MKLLKSKEAHDIYYECGYIVDDYDRVNRMNEMKKELSFYFNAQWESQESDDLEATGQSDVVLNAMRRAFRTLISLMIAPHPTAKFMPRNLNITNPEEDADTMLKLESLQGLWNHCWYISGGSVLLKRAVQSQIITGLGYIGIEKDPEADYYRGELKFNSILPWEKVIPLNSVEPDFSDADKQWNRRVISIAAARKKLGNGKDDEELVNKLRKVGVPITDSHDYEVNMLGPDREHVKTDRIRKRGDVHDRDDNLFVEWIDQDERIKVPARLFKLDREGMIDTVVYVPRDRKSVPDNFDAEEFLAEQEIEYNSYESVDIDVPKIERSTIVGWEWMVDQPEILPVSNYPDIPLLDEDTYNPLPFGEAFFVKPAQKLLNKVFSLAVLHLQTSGSGDRLVGFKGAFGETPQDVENFQKHYSMPFSTTEVEPEYREGARILDLMQRIPATPLQPAAVQLMQTLTYWIDRLTGIDPMAFGQSGGAPRTLGATMSIKEWGDENARIPIMYMNYALQKLGNVWLEWALDFYINTKQFSVPDHNGLISNHIINRRNGDRVENNLDKLKADIFVTSGTTLMVNRYSMLMMFKELMPLNPVFTKMFLLYSDIPDKFELLQEIDQTAKLEQTLEQLIPQIQQMQQEIANKDQNIQDLEKKIDLTKFNSTLKQIETKYREYMKYKKATVDLVEKERREAQ